jgi:hypothetical protein
MTKTRSVVAALAATLAFLAACGGSSGPPTGPQIGGQLGCTTVAQEHNDALYVQERWNCDTISDELVTLPDGAKGHQHTQTTIVMFADSSARDDYRTLYEHFGGKVLNQGDTWLETK